MDGQFELKSAYQLQEHERRSAISSVSFSDDDKAYYCVGASDTDSQKCRILIFVVKDEALELIAVKVAQGEIFALIPFNGMLLAGTDYFIRLYKWKLQGDGTRTLHSVCKREDCVASLQARGNFIAAGRGGSMVLLVYEDGKILERGRYVVPGFEHISAVELMPNELILGTGFHCHLWASHECRLVGGYFLGEIVRRFRPGTSQPPIAVYGTTEGAIGVIASLPPVEYEIMKRLQSNLRTLVRSIGGFSHEDWRSIRPGTFNGVGSIQSSAVRPPETFLDGDFIQLFLDLDYPQMEVISRSLSLSVEDLCKTVHALTFV